MTHLLNCPVCGYTEISGNSCPNCDTDLSLIRSLTQLPASNQQTQKAGRWQAGAALLILMIGVCLGTLGSFLFLQPSQLLTTTVNSPLPVVRDAESTPSSVVLESTEPPQSKQYAVMPGDNLTLITEKFCGKGESWQVMVKANPQLKGRENWINVNEVLKLPNCEG